MKDYTIKIIVIIIVVVINVVLISKVISSVSEVVKEQLAKDNTVNSTLENNINETTESEIVGIVEESGVSAQDILKIILLIIGILLVTFGGYICIKLMNKSAG